MSSAAHTTPLLAVNNLVVEFPARSHVYRAVDDVSFTLERGKTLCLVGESGSGKSVTARSILQILDPPGRIASGQIVLTKPDTASLDLARLGDRSRKMRSVRGRDVAMIFQEPMSSLSPIHTIGNQIVEAIRLHEPVSKDEARARAADLLRQVEIPSPEVALDRYTFEFSGGMRQRAMIAMALACSPAVLIADEPTTALDVTIQAEILDLIRDIQSKRDMAVLFISHDMGVVAEIADEVAVMRFGKIVESGSALQIFEAPQHSYTKTLLDSVLELERPEMRRSAKRGDVPFGAPVIAVKSLNKRFGSRNKGSEGLLAVDGANLELRAGENLGIVGESGSGKTTLGRCIQRIHTVSSGQVLYTDAAGRSVDLATLGENGLREPWRDIRTVFQDPFASLNPRMTVEQIIGEPLYAMGKLSGPALRARVAELLELVGLPASAMSRYPHAFSGGQRQRISIARALAPDPRVIIADEATSALDVSLRRQVLDLMLDLQQRLDLSFIFISHDFAVVRYFCDRVAVMHKGKIVEQGPTDQICENPQHPYTRSLLSAIPVTDPRARGSKQRFRYDATAV